MGTRPRYWLAARAVLIAPEVDIVFREHGGGLNAGAVATPEGMLATPPMVAAASCDPWSWIGKAAVHLPLQKPSPLSAETVVFKCPYGIQT